jgi:hypothetical protein
MASFLGIDRHNHRKGGIKPNDHTECEHYRPMRRRLAIQPYMTHALATEVLENPPI